MESIRDDAVTGYPRKQMRRASWVCLNGAWRFRFDPAAKSAHPASVDAWDAVIEVPFAPESKRSGIADEEYHPCCWYQRDFEITPRSDRRVLLHFGAVDYEARVWVNDRYVGGHEGGYAPFFFDITDDLDRSGKQTVTVRVTDDPLDLSKPRGKQDWQPKPHSIWYPRTTGIWQTVWLEEVPRFYIERIRWEPHLERWEIGCEVFLNEHERGDLRVRVKLTAGEQVLVNDTYDAISGEVHRRIALSDPGVDDYRNELLWSPEKPTLIQADVQMLKGDAVVDEVKSYTALRRVGTQGDRFLLNGRPYYLRLILDQGYWPDTLMTSPSEDALRDDVALIKSAGFNGVRKHQKIEDPNFLYWADVFGLLVWEEMPSAYRFNSVAVRRTVGQWMEAIERDFNHPCVVTWVPFNESWGVPDLPQKAAHQNCVQAMYHLTRTLDETRPVVGNDGWESTATDILGIHDYDCEPHRLVAKYGAALPLKEILTNKRSGGRLLTLEGYPHTGQPVMLTEFGGIAFINRKKNDSPGAWGYSEEDSAKDLQKKYADLLRAVHKIELFSGFCYTQFTDTFQEANGLFYPDRTPKFPIEEIRRVTLGNEHEHGELGPLPGFGCQCERERLG